MFSQASKSWSQGKSSRAARSAVFSENSKWWTKIHTRLTWVSRVKKVIQQLYWLITSFGFNWGQSCLATLVTKIAQKCLEILLLLYNLHILAPYQKKVFVFSSNFWGTFVAKKQLLIVFWATFGQLFEKFRETFWKISSNLWKAPLIPSVHVLSGYSYVSLKFGCCSHNLNFGSIIRLWETAHLPLPYADINTFFSLSAKCWLRGRVGGQFPRNV